ncbi:MAG: hypothetical protein JNM79_23610 [Burkholderiales bacterium]|nr:hypothetical protein [Burkholderiales bacterium]
METLIVLVAFAAVIAVFVLLARRNRTAITPGARTPASGRRAEAMFKAMFPDLQPWFHPAKVAEFVARHRTRANPPPPVWRRPAGFAVDEARFELSGDRERVRLIGPGDAEAAAFEFQRQPKGGIVRVGQGKFTIDIGRRHHVRYWHPEREFKWNDRGEWEFLTRVAERPIEADERGTRFSDNDTSSGSSTTARVATAAGAAAIVAGGAGAFAGGGASDGWEAAQPADGNGADTGSDSGGSTAY